MPPSSAPVTAFAIPPVPLGEVAPVIFLLVFLIWIIYTLIAAYHWIRYSDSRVHGIAAIVTHIIVSSWLAIYAVSGLVH